MTFFNKKEEVIQVELTQYGKYLLSKGKLKAKYYEFFDDDVLYDSEYGGTKETNADSGNRIKEETVSLKTQYVFSGIETNIKKAAELKRKNKLKDSDKNLQQTAEKHYFSSAPLGNSDLGSQYNPSWKIKALKGQFSSIKTQQSGYHQVLFSPEITVQNVEYKAVLAKKESGLPSDPNVPQDGDAENAGSVMNSDPLNASTVFSDNTFFKIIPDFLLLDVSELYTDKLQKNFEIEVFVEETNEITGQKELIPLYFRQKINQIENNILLDKVAQISVDEYDIASDATLVEHYLNLDVDEEIPLEVLCKYLPPSEKEFSFSGQQIDCGERSFANQNDLYNTDADGDFCD